MSEKSDTALVEVWKQSLVEDKSAVALGGRNFAVTTTAQKRLKQVEFEIEGRMIRGSSRILRPRADGPRWLSLVNG
jgi:hypothetical protein